MVWEDLIIGADSCSPCIKSQELLKMGPQCVHQPHLGPEQGLVRFTNKFTLQFCIAATLNFSIPFKH